MLQQMALFCFLRLSSIYIVYMHQIFFIPSPLDGQIGCCHVLTTVNSAAMKTGVYLPFKIIVCLCMPRNETASSHGNSIFRFF